MQFWYGDVPGPENGGGGGGQDIFAFSEDERIVKVTGRYGSRVDSLTFTTNLRTYGPFGETFSDPLLLSCHANGPYPPKYQNKIYCPCRIS